MRSTNTRHREGNGNRAQAYAGNYTSDKYGRLNDSDRYLNYNGNYGRGNYQDNEDYNDGWNDRGNRDGHDYPGHVASQRGYQGYNSYGERKDYNGHERNSDRNFFERVGDRVKNTWRHLTDRDDMEDNMRRFSNRRNEGNYSNGYNSSYDNYSPDNNNNRQGFGKSHNSGYYQENRGSYPRDSAYVNRDNGYGVDANAYGHGDRNRNRYNDERDYDNEGYAGRNASDYSSRSYSDSYYYSPNKEQDVNSPSAAYDDYYYGNNSQRRNNGYYAGRDNDRNEYSSKTSRRDDDDDKNYGHRERPDIRDRKY